MSAETGSSAGGRRRCHRPAMEASRHGFQIPARRLRAMLDQAAAAGAAPAALLEALDLPAALAEPDTRALINLADYYRIQNRLAYLTSDETCHLSARQLLTGSTDFVLRHVGDARSLAEAMQIIAETYNLLHGGVFNTVERRRADIEYVIDDRDFPYTLDQTTDDAFFSVECILIFLHSMLLLIAPAAVQVKALHVRRPRPVGVDGAHLAYWRAPVSFGATRYRVVFDGAAAAAPIEAPTPDTLTTAAVQQKIIEMVSAAGEPARDGGAAAPTLTQRVRGAIARGLVEQSSVATEFGLSVATLRRRLQAEGAQFRTLRREVLNARAQDILRERRPVVDVAAQLGIAEFRRFNRAFKEWNGVTPTQFIRAETDARQG